MSIFPLTSEIKGQRSLSASEGLLVLKQNKSLSPTSKKSNIIVVFQRVLSQINTYRTQLKKGIPRKELTLKTSDINIFILRLSSTLLEIHEKVEELSKETSFS